MRKLRKVKPFRPCLGGFSSTCTKLAREGVKTLTAHVGVSKEITKPFE